jgi:hypothetical protein
MAVEKFFGKNKDFYSEGGALTLSPEDVGAPEDRTGTFTHAHPAPDGWTITGEVREDYFYWVNKFYASHPEHGTVEGDFEEKVTASSEEAFNHFMQFHAPRAWDYYDI